MPVGRPPWRHALIGGVIAGLLWESATFAGTSPRCRKISSLTTAIVVLLSLEIVALVPCLAQVIAEYERTGRGFEPSDGLGLY